MTTLFYIKGNPYGFLFSLVQFHFTIYHRKIKSYYNPIKKNDKKHTAYEMIIGIYGKDANGNPVCPEYTRKEIMREFVDEWQNRNPNLEMIGAYYHIDEQGGPHVHIDYIPVAHGYTRGLEIQNGLVKRLEKWAL